VTVPFSDFSASSPVRPYARLYEGLGKRFLDLMLVVLAAPVTIPLVGLILLATWREGGRPLYVQHRIGRGGRLFRCWKVRTMVKDADGVLEKLIGSDPALATEWHLNQKLSCDPRITRLGRFLRRTSLDELPQLWNVLNGTMSLVGPRPFTPEQQELYAGGRAAAYYSLRPGLSGLWQVSRRNSGSFSERVAYDDEYCRSVSLRTDAVILWRTVLVVLRATGI
jgi:exopolysaccharide production protein ExoY